LGTLLGVASATYGGGGGHYESDHSVNAAVKSQHSVSTFPVASTQDAGKTPVVDIVSNPLPLTLRFQSHSTQINAIQKHFGNPGQVQKSSSIDEPDLLIQNIKKPIIQEIHEVITPSKYSTQTTRIYSLITVLPSPVRRRKTILNPVQEKSETLIAKSENYGGGHGYGGGQGYGGGHGYGGGYSQEGY